MKHDLADESVVEIDEFALDREWLNQPRLVMRYAIKLAKAKRAMLERKADLDVKKAEIEYNIRSLPANYGLTKVTETAIEGALLRQKSYQEALNEYNDARYKVDLLSGIMEALDNRKKALENLVTLHGQNYFSQPRATGKEREALEHQTKEKTQRAIRKSSNKR